MELPGIKHLENLLSMEEWEMNVASLFTATAKL
jgi:hypothetical protein